MGGVAGVGQGFCMGAIGFWVAPASLTLLRVPRGQEIVCVIRRSQQSRHAIDEHNILYHLAPPSLLPCRQLWEEYTNWAKEMSHRYYAPNSVATPKFLIS